MFNLPWLLCSDAQLNPRPLDCKSDAVLTVPHIESICHGGVSTTNIHTLRGVGTMTGG